MRNLSNAISNLSISLNERAIPFSSEISNKNKTPAQLPFTTISYKCPSNRIFKLPLFEINDQIKRQELTLPETDKNKIIFDPLLNFQIERQMPSFNKNSEPMYCGRPLFSELKWRSRKMNIKKRKKYQKKMFYVIQKRRQAKEKRYQGLLSLFQSIQEKRVEKFDPLRFIQRELEKAKFYGYRCSPIYDSYRDLVNTNLKSFDEKYFRKFEDTKKPIHLNYPEFLDELKSKKKSEKK